MAWSTKQLADLTGVTLRSLRHWHDIGLLPEPERLSNGYKQYAVQHLVHALRIARLASLGFSLDQVGRMLESEEDAQASLHTLRTELSKKIDQLSRIRSNVDAMIDHCTSPDLSPETLLVLDTLGGDPGSNEIAIVLSHILPRNALPTFVETMQDIPADLAYVNTEIANLPADAPEEQITSLARHGAALIAGFLTEREGSLSDIDTRAGRQVGVEEMIALITEHLNHSQREAVAMLVDLLTQDHQ